MVAPNSAIVEGSSLRIVDVTKSFASPDASGSRTQALDGVSLSVAAGELVSLVGRSDPSGTRIDTRPPVDACQTACHLPVVARLPGLQVLTRSLQDHPNFLAVVDPRRDAAERRVREEREAVELEQAMIRGGGVDRTNRDGTKSHVRWCPSAGLRWSENPRG